MRSNSRYRFTLDPGSKKYRCPSCGKLRFVRFIDQETGVILPSAYGRCDREISCGYFLSPYHDDFAKNMKETGSHYAAPATIRSKPVKCNLPGSISSHIVEKTFAHYDENNLIQYLSAIFDHQKILSLVSQYNIGTSKYWQGATIFWQKDINGKYRTGKIMLYDPHSGRRIKNGKGSMIQWVHKVIGLSDFQLSQCFFGEHLLQDSNDKAIAVVESEKTAIIAAGHYPDLIWLATGGSQLLSEKTAKVLENKTVILFPDLEVYDSWKEKAKIIKQSVKGIRIFISKLLQNNASTEERQKGLDLADYLIN
jgi:hypothetical protein